MNREGMRFIVSPTRDNADWRHYLELEGYENWTDCTDMTDAEFDAFMQSPEE